MHAPRTSCCWSLVVAGVLCSSLERSPAAASDSIRTGPELFLGHEESLHPVEPATGDRWYSLLSVMPATSDATDGPRRRDLRLEMTPLVDGIIDAVRQSGIPIQPIHGASAAHLIGVSVSFKVSEDLPAISFYARERSPELFGAFYPARRGVSWSLVWPVRQFSFRLQGGNDSEFDYLAIAGIEWSHRIKPLAIGVGMPMMNLHGAGHVGGVVLLRLKF